MQRARSKYFSLLLWTHWRELWQKFPVITLYSMFKTSSGTFTSQDLHQDPSSRAQSLLNREATTWHLRGSLHHCSSSRCRRQMRGFTIVHWGTQKQGIHEELNRNKERSQHLQDVEERWTIIASPPTPNSAFPQVFPFAPQEKTFESNNYIQWASLVAQLVMSLQCRRPPLDSWVRKIPWRRVKVTIPVFLGFPGGSDGKESPCNAGDLCSVPGLVRFPGAELQYSCLENPHGQRCLEGYSPWGRKELDMTE